MGPSGERVVAVAFDILNHMGKTGRPSSYSVEIADQICRELADGKGLAQICTNPDYPDHVTVRNWILKDTDGFFNKYARAKDFGMDYQAEMMMRTIDDEEDVLRARLKVDTLKWYISKIAPKKYGDKQTIEHTGEVALADRISKARNRK